MCVIGLHLVAETALTPFLPELFHRLYGIEDPDATGVYLWICRLVGLAALPLWGLAARWVGLHRLILLGLCGSTVLDLLLGLAPSYAVYTGLSMAVVATNSAMLLAYPALIAAHGADGEREGDRDTGRLRGIRVAVAVFHLAVVVSTLVGAGVLALPEPRVGISAFAVLDALLAWCAWRLLPRPAGRTAAAFGGTAGPVTTGAVPCRRATVARPAEADPGGADPGGADPGGTAARRRSESGARDARGTERVTVRRRVAVLLLVHVSVLGVMFDFSVNVVRPFFAMYAEESGATGVAPAVLFFLPSVAALGVLPLAGRAHRRLGALLLPAAMTVASAGLAWQALAPGIASLTAGRLVFGVGLGLGQVAVDLRMFRLTGATGPAFAWVETVRAGALLAAPVAAATAVARGLALPLVAGAVLLLAGAGLALAGRSGDAVAARGGAPEPSPSPPPDPARAAVARAEVAPPAGVVQAVEVPAQPGVVQAVEVSVPRASTTARPPRA